MNSEQHAATVLNDGDYSIVIDGKKYKYKNAKIEQLDWISQITVGTEINKEDLESVNAVSYANTFLGKNAKTYALVASIILTPTNLMARFNWLWRYRVKRNAKHFRRILSTKQLVGLFSDLAQKEDLSNFMIATKLIAGVRTTATKGEIVAAKQ